MTAALTIRRIEPPRNSRTICLDTTRKVVCLISTHAAISRSLFPTEHEQVGTHITYRHEPVTPPRISGGAEVQAARASCLINGDGDDSIPKSGSSVRSECCRREWQRRMTRPGHQSWNYAPRYSLLESEVGFRRLPPPFQRSNFHPDTSRVGTPLLGSTCSLGKEREGSNVGQTSTHTLGTHTNIECWGRHRDSMLQVYHINLRGNVVDVVDDHVAFLFIG